VFALEKRRVRDAFVVATTAIAAAALATEHATDIAAVHADRGH
jgi:hypothetical protein